MTLLIAATACTASTTSEPAAPSATITTTEIPAATPVKAQRLLEGDLSDLPRLRTQLPRTVPTTYADLPSLLADPPGRAMLSYHPPEGFDGRLGWASETLLFYGRDGRWRRLNLDELGLPEEAWTGQDTYGAGALSPDGRWWAGRSRQGVVLIDMATGEHSVVDTGTTWVSEVEWRSDSAGVYVASGHRGETHLVSVPNLKVMEQAYQFWHTGIAPDGTVLSLRRERVGSATLVQHVDGELIPRGNLTIPGLGRGWPRRIGVLATEDRFAILHQADPLHFRRVELIVVDTETVEVEQVLRFNNEDYYVRRDSWLDPETMLLDAADGLLAWRPAEAKLLRVLDVEPADQELYWTVDLALDTIS